MIALFINLTPHTNEKNHHVHRPHRLSCGGGRLGPTRAHASGTYQFTREGGEYFLYFNGETADIYVNEPYPLKRLEDGELTNKGYFTSLKDAWGDDSGLRSSKHIFGAPYFDGQKPSIFLARGIYTRHKMIAYDVGPSTHKLTVRWAWANNQWGPRYGQGYHNYFIQRPQHTSPHNDKNVCFNALRQKSK